MPSESKLDILAITETHLCNKTLTEEVMITGYNVAKVDRRVKKAVAVYKYYSDSLHIYERDDLKMGH